MHGVPPVRPATASNALGAVGVLAVGVALLCQGESNHRIDAGKHPDRANYRNCPYCGATLKKGEQESSQ